MWKYISSIVLTFMATAAAHADLRIVTTTTDFADLARQIGGDHVQVHSVMKGPENVHNVMAKPTEMLELNKADLFVHSGLDAEPWRDNLIKGARNSKILFGTPGYVDMSKGIELKGVPTNGKGDRSQGDMHAYGNPHYTPSLDNAQRMVITLVHAMAENDPANAQYYKDNAKKLLTKYVALEDELEKQFAPYRGLKVVTFHASWEYFADQFGIDIVTEIEPKPGITPSPGQMKDVIDTMKQQNVKIVIVETYDSYDIAKTIADAAGATCLVLPDHVLGTPDADTYENLFRTNIKKLIAAAKQAGIKPNATSNKNDAAGKPAHEGDLDGAG